MKYKIIIVFLTISSLLFTLSIDYREGNELIINDVQVYADSNFTLQIDVENEDEFVSFQFDIILPENIQYIENSAILSDRAQDHSLSVAMINNNTIRALAFSLNSTPFLGNEGCILQLDFSQNLELGEYLVGCENAILANSSSENILTNIVNGYIIVNPIVSINDNFNYSVMENISNYPNPFNPTTKIEYALPFNSDVILTIFNIKGQLIYMIKKNNLPVGHHYLYWKGKK